MCAGTESQFSSDLSLELESGISLIQSGDLSLSEWLQDHSGAAWARSSPTERPSIARPARPVSHPASSMSGLTIEGRIVLEDRIGRGGMGEIYRGSMDGRKVAVKIFNPSAAFTHSDPSSLERRFLREAVVPARLQSSHAVRIYDAGQTNRGLLYIVMELLSGRTLKAAVDAEGPLPPRRAVPILRGVCDALRELHDHRYVHRDIKPLNVMLVERNHDPDHSVLLDYGLVRQMGGADAYGELTLPGTGIGTPMYASPEQLQFATFVDQRTDVYSLGAMLYFVLTGAPPFSGANVRAVIRAQIHDDPPPVPAQVRGNHIPEALRGVADRCLSKARADRYANVSELDVALRASIATRPSSGLPSFTP